MPNFDIDDVLAEATQVAQLLQSRPPTERDQLGQGLLKGILFKLDGMRLTAGDVIKFSVVLGNLPSELAAQLQSSLDSKLVQDMQTTDTIALHPSSISQRLIYIHNYLTEKQWATLEDPSSSWGLKVSVLVGVLRKLGVVFLHEQTVKWTVGLLVTLQSDRAQCLPKYKVIFQAVEDFKSAFRSSVPGKNSKIREFPEDPRSLPDEFYKTVWNTGEEPITKELPRLAQVANQHIPLRKTSKLLTAERADDDKRLNSTASGSGQCANDMLQMLATLLQKQAAPAHRQFESTVPSAADFKPRPRLAASEYSDSGPSDSSPPHGRLALPPPPPQGSPRLQVLDAPRHDAGTTSEGQTKSNSDDTKKADKQDENQDGKGETSSDDKDKNGDDDAGLDSEEYEKRAFAAMMANGGAGKKTTGRGGKKGQGRGMKKPAAALSEPNQAEARTYKSRGSYTSKYSHEARKRALDAGASLEDAKRQASAAYQAAAKIWDAL